MRRLVLPTLLTMVFLAVPATADTTATTPTAEVSTSTQGTLQQVTQQTTQQEQTPGASGELLPQVAPKALGYIAVGAILCAIPNRGTQELGADLTQLGAEALTLAAAVDHGLPLKYPVAYQFNRTYEKLSSPMYWGEVGFNIVAPMLVNSMLYSMLQPLSEQLEVPPDVIKNYIVQTCKLMAKLQDRPVSPEDVIPVIDSAIQIINQSSNQSSQSKLTEDTKYEVAKTIANFLNGIRGSSGVLIASNVCKFALRYINVEPSNGIKLWIGSVLSPVVPDVSGTISDVRNITRDINNAMIGVRIATNPVETIRQITEDTGNSIIETFRTIVKNADKLGISEETANEILDDLKSMISDLTSTITDEIVRPYEPIVRCLGIALAINSLMDAYNSFNRLTQRLSKLALIARGLGVQVPTLTNPEGELKRALGVLQQGRVGPPPLPF
ncbi:hypothetical protein [Methanopyrus kandleri]|uniref:Uncharacterized protein n=2 Tax=Methanopyrus kandleri TaxID=2320 RepID=Q8TX41_METKA|nr:hypothetical protein [Methanopyrus kandleri]AAM02049.1 Uncharacterized protein MK0836 [Methanopyrus kandleri AV19]HII69936.1 hypothetical protein [Methanopyrus kandleri]